MADAGDVGGTFEAVGQTDTSDLTKRGVGLFRGHGTDRRANAPALGALLEDRRIGLVLHLLPALANQLVNGRHSDVSS